MRSDGLFLAIESSARPASAAAEYRGRRLERVLVEDRAHASDLLPAIDLMAKELGAAPRETSLVVVGVGPGSYTGLRVGIATALGLCRAAGATALGIPSGEALCCELGRPGETLSVVLDARSGGATLASYRRIEVDGGPEVETVAAPAWIPVGELARSLPAHGRLLVDATIPDLCGLDAAQRARCEPVRPPRAGALLALGLARTGRGHATPLEALQPLYLRDFVPSPRKS